MCQPRGSQIERYCGCLPLRRFFSSKEEQEWLENYRDQLKKELEGAEERIKELKRK